MQNRDASYEVAYEYLKNRIINDDFPEDYTFVESEIANELGMSRTPVREAIRMLKAEKLLIRVPKKGIVCRKLQQTEIKSIFEMAEALEGMMAYNVARHHTAAQLEALNKCVTEMEAALRNQDSVQWAAGDISFHKSLKDFCGNSFLIDAMDDINIYISVIRNRYTLKDVSSQMRSTVQHREMYEAIKSGDADYARMLVQYHFRGKRREYTRG